MVMILKLCIVLSVSAVAVSFGQSQKSDHGTKVLLMKYVEEQVEKQVKTFKDELETSNLKISELQQKIENDQINHEGEKKSLIEMLEGLERRLLIQESLTLKIVPRACQEYADMGVTRSGIYLIDPDGAGIGEAAFNVTCDMETGSTIINHNSMDETAIEHCKGPGCFSKHINYQATERQIKSLIDESKDCTQSILYECFISPLVTGRKLSWWIDSKSLKQYYWTGSNPDHQKCDCGLTNSCQEINEVCNCDAKVPAWLRDTGTLTNKQSLPVKAVYFGGLKYESQRANFTLGPLKCTGSDSMTKSSKSLETQMKDEENKTDRINSQLQNLYKKQRSLETKMEAEEKQTSIITGKLHYVEEKQNVLHNKLQGEEKSTEVIRQLQSLDKKQRSLEMKLEAEEKKTGRIDTKLQNVEKRQNTMVAFEVYRIRDGYVLNNTKFIGFDAFEMQVGGGMDLATGVFTAPVAGIYSFTSTWRGNCLASSANGTWLYLRKNGSVIGTTKCTTNDDHSVITVLVSLIKGNTVDTFLSEGYIYSNDLRFVRFTGHLIYTM